MSEDSISVMNDILDEQEANGSDGGESNCNRREPTSDEEPLTFDASEPVRMSVQELDWATMPEDMRSRTDYISVEQWGEEYLRVPLNRLSEMDAAAKCWKSIPADSPSLLVKETDGGVWAFCQGCVANIPKDLQEFLYFFHMLQCHIVNLNHYAVPSKNVVLRRDRATRKHITDIVWHKPKNDIDFSRSVGGHGLNFTEILCERARSQESRTDFTIKVPPFKIHMGFTGAVYEHDGQRHRKSIAVLLVTCCRNFDMLGYIQDQFLRDKKEDLKKMDPTTQQLKHIWKKMARVVAFDNLCVDERVVGMPEDYADQPGGVLGCDTLFNMFQIPLQIYGIIQKDLRERARNANPSADLSLVCPKNLRIIGLPEMEFRRGDEAFDDYVKYMLMMVDNYVNERAGLAQCIKKYYKPKEKGEDKEAAQDDDSVSYNLPCWGGWPLAYNHAGFSKFGLPPLPLYLEFAPEHRPDYYGGFDTWLASMGGPNGIPKLTNTVIRAFLVQDLSVDHATIFKTLEHFLQDHRIANPALVLQEYYGEYSDPLCGLMTAGYLRSWWSGLQKDIQTQRAQGLVLSEAISSFNRYIVSSKKHHWSSIVSGCFRSTRIVQTLSILEKLDMVQVAKGHPTKSIQAFQKTLCRCMSNERALDPYQRANEGFWKCFELLNRSYTMNSSNLEGLIEIMMSQLLWMFGPYNETWAGYFQGIQFVSGNGHFRLTTKDGTSMDVRKPNSTGMDWTVGRLTELFQSLLDIVGIVDPKQNQQAPLNCMGWTPASIPNITSAVITEGHVTSLPDPSLGLRSIVATEIRGDSLKALIHTLPRDFDGQDKISFNTSDPKQTGERKVQEKKKIVDYMLCTASTNVPIQSEQQREEWKTLLAVMHVMNPGAAPYMKRRKTGAFNDVVCHAFGGRQTKPVEQEQIAYFLPYTHVWGSVIALMNKSGVIPMEMNPSVLGFLDWVFFYVKEHMRGAFEINVEESFKRIKDGYEARQVAKTMWTQVIMNLPYASSQEDLTMRIMHNMYANAVPLGDSLGAVYNFLTRGLHMGCLLMISCIAKHFEVPIIDVEVMCELMECDQVPESGPMAEAAAGIRNFMLKSAAEHRMCPASFYITSDGTQSGAPKCEKSSMLRAKKGKGGTEEDILQNAAKKIKNVFGKQLTETCHCGPEESIYRNALSSLMLDFNPDLRKLFTNKLYKAQQLCAKLGILQVVHAEDWPDDSDYPPPFARMFNFGQPNEESATMGIGVHPFLLIFYVAIAKGATLHPKISSDWARTVLSRILSMAPRAATPGNLFLVRSYDLNTTMHQRVVVPNKERCNHFVRPIFDLNFANTGVCTYARAMQQFMPEDCLHCGPLFRFAALFKCDVMDLPGRDLHVLYEIMASTYYVVYRASDKAYGTLFVHPSEKRVVVKLEQPDEEFEWGFEDWQENLRETDFIMPPMVWRSGAAVRLRNQSGDCVGCLIEHETYKSNFNPESCSYEALWGREGECIILNFLRTYENLIPVGTQLFLLLNSANGSRLKASLTTADQNKPLLAVRLNVPTSLKPVEGKLYITCIKKSMLARSDTADMTSLSMAVDPWEVVLEPGEGQGVAQWLTNKPLRH